MSNQLLNDVEALGAKVFAYTRNSIATILQAVEDDTIAELGPIEDGIENMALEFCPNYLRPVAQGFLHSVRENGNPKLTDEIKAVFGTIMRRLSVNAGNADAPTLPGKEAEPTPPAKAPAIPGMTADDTHGGIANDGDVQPPPPVE